MFGFGWALPRALLLTDVSQVYFQDSKCQRLKSLHPLQSSVATLIGPCKHMMNNLVWSIIFTMTKTPYLSLTGLLSSSYLALLLRTIANSSVSFFQTSETRRLEDSAITIHHSHYTALIFIDPVPLSPRHRHSSPPGKSSPPSVAHTPDQSLPGMMKQLRI